MQDQVLIQPLEIREELPMREQPEQETLIMPEQLQDHLKEQAQQEEFKIMA